MKFRTFQLFALFVSFLSIVSCSTTPSNQSITKAALPVAVDPFYISPSEINPNAKRYLKNIGAGDSMLKLAQHSIEIQAISNPGVGELTRRAFANITAENLENLAARVYSRHLTNAVLEDMANFTDGTAGGKLYRFIFEKIGEGKAANRDEIMRQLNADELKAIIKFTQSATFTSMSKEMPEIDLEIRNESSRVGELVIKAYINK